MKKYIEINTERGFDKSTKLETEIHFPTISAIRDYVKENPTSGSISELSPVGLILVGVGLMSKMINPDLLSEKCFDSNELLAIADDSEEVCLIQQGKM